MTYRRFCRPSDVMKEFLRRYKSLAQYDGISPDVRSWALIKYVWLSQQLVCLLTDKNDGSTDRMDYDVSG